MRKMIICSVDEYLDMTKQTFEDTFEEDTDMYSNVYVMEYDDGCLGSVVGIETTHGEYYVLGDESDHTHNFTSMVSRLIQI